MSLSSSSYSGAKIKVIGIGGAGNNAVNTMIKAQIEGVDFIAANTDVQSLSCSLAPLKIQVGKELTKGLGAGADPDIGRDAALEDRHEIQESIAHADMVFITAGMGGGTGTGGASVVAQIAKDHGALTVGVVTKPFLFEGNRRKKHANFGISRLKEYVDTLIVIPNEKLLKIVTPETTMNQAFQMADNVLVNAVRGISDIINIPGRINVDFADVKTVMSCTGHALMGIGTSSSQRRASEAALQAISCPLLDDVDIEGATGILINITANESLTLLEINEICTIIQEAAHEEANIIFGTVVDDDMENNLRVTVIATGFPYENESTKKSFHELKQKSLSFHESMISSQQMYMPEPKKEISHAPERADKDFEKLAFMTLGKQSPRETLAQQTKSIPIPAQREIQVSEKINYFAANEDDNFVFSKYEEKVIPDSMKNIENEIDRKIDEALEMAERIKKENTMSDDLDIPTFIRNGDNELNF